MTNSEIVNNIVVPLHPLFSFIRRAKVFNRVENGGFGTLELTLQVKGKRGRYIYDTLFDKNNWQYAHLRAKIQFMLMKAYSHNNPNCLYQKDGIPHVEYTPWWTFLIGQSLKIGTKDFSYKSKESRVYFSTKELAYLDAWFDIIRSIRPNTRAIKAKALNLPFTEFLTSVDSAIEPEILPAPFGPQNLNPDLFRSHCKKFQLAKKEHLVSNSVHSLLPTATYEKFWKDLKKSIFFQHQHFTYIHLFHLGGDVKTFNHYPLCMFCKTPIPTGPGKAFKEHAAAHIYLDCHFTHLCWRRAGLSGRPNPALCVGTLNEMSPLVDKFLFYIRTLIVSRKLEHNVTDTTQRNNSVEHQRAATLAISDLTEKSLHQKLTFFDLSYNKFF
ncbi:hypothetical protein JCM33374_g5020 [Metschnikowia sp. JCM 33374]|nr:hypothetical protein JCM33374_g5020 [Metschnikowia sp. JCM 33374]